MNDFAFPSQNQSEINLSESQQITGNWSSLEVNSGNLRELIQGKPEGAISRFLQDGLHILLWNRHPEAPGRIFWAEFGFGRDS